MARSDSFQKKWASVPSQFERPTDALIDRGWAGGAAEDPPEAKWENWWHNRVDEALAEIESKGAMQWFDDVAYAVGSTARDGDQNYIAAIASTGIQPGSASDVGHWFQAPIGLNGANGISVYSAAGSYTWPVPVGVKNVLVTVIGGGGGGSRRSTTAGLSAGGGGAGGGYANKLVDLTGVSSVNVTVGAGGAGASTDNTGGAAGGSSSFGSYLSASGGAGGGGAGGPSAGGVGVGGDLNSSLGPGSGGADFTTGSGTGNTRISGAGGGPGGESIFTAAGSSIAGKSAIGPGGGGSGSVGTANGGAGAAGIVIIKW